MKSLLTALSVLTIGTTTGNLLISSGKNALETNIIYQNSYQNSKEIPDVPGINEISYSYIDGVGNIKVVSKILRHWLSYPDPKTRLNIITNDLTNQHLFKHDNIISDDVINTSSNIISNNISELANTPHSFIYGIDIYINYKGAHPYIDHINFQFSSDSKNSSYTQENYCFLCHNQLNVFISRKQWENIYLTEKHKDNITQILINFPQDPAWQKSEISKEYLEIMAQIIINHFDEINNHFKSSEIRGTGWSVYGNTLCECKGIYEEK